jgi:tetratricopeptide (TPR) repeat protein
MGSSQNTLKSEEQAYEITLDEALSLAQGHHQSGSYVLAERTYRDILRTVPDHFPTTQFLGVLLFQTGNYDEAKHYLQIAVETNPDDAQCINNYGGILTQLGEHEKAIELYDKALALNPDYLDALNNKAQALWFTDKFKAAEAVCRKALAVAPDNVLALNNLGIVLARLYKFEESLDAWEKAAELSPDEAMVWSNWGNVLREMGRVRDSVEKCRKAVDIAPNNPEALNNLANALRDLGKTDEAIELYIKATNARPDYFEAHNNLAIAYADDNLFDKSMVSAKYAVAFNKNFYEGYSTLSRALCEMGEYDQAHTAAQRALALNPDKAESYLDLALVLLKMEQLDDAEAAMQEVLKRQPDSARGYLQLSEIRENLQNTAGAIAAVDDALKMSPDMPMLWVRKALIHHMDNQTEKALEFVEKALQLNPGWYVALHHKAEILISLNRKEEAEKIVRKILGFTKKLPSTYATLTHLKKFTSEDDQDFIDMKALGDEVEGYGNEVSSIYHFAMSEVYEQLKKDDLAFEHLNKANELRFKTLPFVHWKNMDYHQIIKQKYTAEFLEQFKGAGHQSEVPVFILGMPRSGTTLTEQIISAHPDVFGAGELNDLGQVQKLSGTMGERDVAFLGEEYIRRVTARDTTRKALRITDKMPANYMYLGFIASILPNAKIIHCRRNPMDTALSCYKQNFARGQHWTYNLEALAEHYKSYEDLMDHWRTVLPGRFIEVDYEDTVNDLEGQARKLIDYIGLEWNDACLEPHKQKRAVLTASKSQVTKPVYKTSVEKWKRYEKQLQPLVRILRPELALPEDAA